MQSALEQAAGGASSVGAAVSLLLAAATGAIGLLTGWAGAYLKVRGEKYATRAEFVETLRQLEETTRRVERIKSEVAAEISTGVALGRELRDAVRGYAEAVGGLTHSMCWLTWDCKVRERLDPEMVKAYDVEVHRLSPAIVGQLAVVSMLDRRIADKLAPWADEVFSLDADVGNAVVKAEGHLQTGLPLLVKLHADANQFEKVFRAGLLDLLKP